MTNSRPLLGKHNVALPNLESVINSDTDPFYTTVSWRDYWDEKIKLENGFVVYVAGQPSYMESKVKNSIECKARRRCYLFMIHGAGCTSMTWSLVAEKAKSIVQLFAVDLRGHGKTKVNFGDNSEFSTETLTNDLTQVILDVVNRYTDEKSVPNIYIMGHSVGGAISVKICLESRIKNWVKGLFVIDIVEGLAVKSFKLMDEIVRRIPSSFNSEEDAIKWALSSRLCNNKKVARVAIPDRLTRNETTGKCNWKVNLFSTRPYWKQWYTGLSQQFLAVSCPKTLIMAGKDRLDKELTIGQMQGKFHLVIVPNSGHSIQEDVRLRVTLTVN